MLTKPRKSEDPMRNGLFTSFDAWFKGICVCLLTMLALSANARAQTQITTGTIQGTVTDANGAVLPGASIVQGPDGDEINFAGQRGIFNNVSFDGGDYNNGFFGEQLGGQRAAIDIPLDAVKEFQVVATGATAEFGRTAAGIINVISKSGTNNLHGSA